MQKYLLLVMLVLAIKPSKAQRDTSFWFAAPDIDIVNHPTYGQYDRPIYLRLTSFNSTSTNVKVSIPANVAFTPINITIPANSSSTINLSPWIDIIENSQPGIISNKGIHIQSTAEITAYYEVNSITCLCNPELFSLKGKNSIGNEFYVPSQVTWSIDTIRFPNARAAFDIVAIENNTNITITPTKPLIGRPANVPITITLNKGQTYSSQALYRNGPNLLNGSKISSNKPIAVTTKEDLLFTDGACADLAGDQLVPISILGNEYAVIRGNLTVRDKAVITAIQNNTNVFLDGSGTPVSTINAGQSYEVDITNQPSLYIRTNNLVNVYHYTGNGCEVGAAIIPKLNCTGSSSVSIVRSNSGNAFVLIVTKNGNQGNFLMNGSAGIINASDFASLNGTGGNYVFCKKNLNGSMPLNAATTFSNTTGKFQLGFINGDPGGYMYGYFSDFKKSNVSTSQTEICRLDSVQLNATGGVLYQWTPVSGLSNPNISNPKASPAVTTDYKVIITDIDGCVDSAFVRVVVNTCSSSACDNWLNTTASNAYFGIGDLDISGNQVTIEALINRTQPYLPGGGNDTEGDIVSKHTDFNDINYLLRPNHAYITTTNGFFGTPEVCDLQLNKTYHVAMVYNGATLKFYRNGFLMSQINATGNLIQNNLNTQIGHYAATFWNTQFLGFINEVRIWNIARTQSQIQSFMNSSLPSPTTQTGLQAYYTFDNLLNKQGNAAWNGTLNGAASINNTNTSCNFIADSCSTVIAPTGISGIINAYTPVLALNPCENKITVENATAYNTGDTVLLIQMKGAIIDMTNTSSFGNITDYKNSGNYEFNYVKSKAGNIIELKNKLTRLYDIPTGKVQLVRVPYYNSITVSDTLTCLPWDGSKGGILVLNVRDTIELNADINTTGKGFLKGIMHNSNSNTFSCGVSGYFFPDNTINAAGKGEGISFLNTSQNSGNGPAANGGGGGMNTNSGGGGGSNGNKGGRGGYEWNGGCPNYLTSGNWGLPGNVLLYNNANNKVFMGGAGGAGHCNNQYDGPTENADFNGGNGGGLIIINSNFLKNNNKKIISKGDSAYELNITNSYVSHDGMGGGGAGGTILLNNNNYINTLFVDVSGGKGGNLVAPVAAPGNVGPGGGGGGGVIWVKQNALPANLVVTNNGGNAGVIVQAGNINYGTTPGLAGINVFSLNVPFDTVLFKPNIDSVRIKDSSTSCLAFDFNGFGYTNTNPVATWNWYFGDGGTANTQNTAHTYATAGTYLVKLVVTDINGCKDSITRNVISNTLSVNAGTDSSFCGGPVSVQLNGTVTGTGNYSWTPAVYLNNSAVLNPVATVNATTTFYLAVTNTSGCSGQDSVTIHVDATPVVKTLGDTAVCKGSVLMLSTTSGLGSYHWSPGIYVSDSTIANPLFVDTVPRTLIVSGSNGACFASDTINVNIKPLPVVYAGADTIICSAQLVSLSASGASSYSWSPAVFLSNPNIANPVFSGNVSTTYFLTGTGVNGCQGKDTVSINVSNSASLVRPPNKSFCSKESVQLDGYNGSAVQYVWTPATYLNNTGIINPVANPPATTTYIVTITDTTCNFDSSFAVIVTVNSLPAVNASRSNDIDCALKNARLSATGASLYTWQPPGTLSSSTIANPVATPITNTLYVVTGSDNNGCKNNDSVTVLVKGGINGYDIPNSFSPNGDSNNECFGIKHWGDAQNVIFIIYSRWGEKVFETNNVNNCWDGTFKGQPAEVGNYVYYASAKTACGDLVRKGNVLLIR